MPVVHRFDPPERFVPGTVGEPGQRTFFLQARAGDQVTSVALEKQQVQILGERVAELLDELIQADDAQTTVPAMTPVGLVDTEPLDSRSRRSSGPARSRCPGTPTTSAS